MKSLVFRLDCVQLEQIFQSVAIYLIFVFGLLFSQLLQDLVCQQHALLVLEALKDTNRRDVYATEVENTMSKTMSRSETSKRSCLPQ